MKRVTVSDASLTVTSTTVRVSAASCARRYLRACTVAGSGAGEVYPGRYTRVVYRVVHTQHGTGVYTQHDSLSGTRKVYTQHDSLSGTRKVHPAVYTPQDTREVHPAVYTPLGYPRGTLRCIYTTQGIPRGVPTVVYTTRVYPEVYQQWYTRLLLPCVYSGVYASLPC